MTDCQFKFLKQKSKKRKVVLPLLEQNFTLQCVTEESKTSQEKNFFFKKKNFWLSFLSH